MGSKRRNRTVMGAMAFAALVWTGPTSAQGPGTAAERVAALPAPDPARLALSERLIDRIWPVGMFRRIMETTMASTVDAVGSMEAAVDWGGQGDDKAARRAQHEARTGRPLIGSSGADTSGPENVEQAVAAMTEAMLPMYEAMEPPLRAALARIYARRYDATQLGELEAFFSTPTGQAYAADSLTLMNDPEMVAAMAEAMGEMANLIPAMMTGAMATSETDAGAAGAVAEATAAAAEAEAAAQAAAAAASEAAAAAAAAANAAVKVE